MVPMSKTPRAILFIFCLLLLAPLAGQFFKLDPFSRHNENRELTERPEFGWSFPILRKFPRQFQDYFNDNFGFRNALVRGNYLLRYELLGVSPSRMVIVGKDGWLYYTGNNEIEDCRGVTRFDSQQLALWTKAAVLKRDWLKQQGIRYLLVIPPNKSSIHPEFLPEGYGRVRKESGLDDYLSYLRRHTDLEVVDLRPPLLAAKGERSLFHRTDTHWNDYGAFLGYREMMRPLAAWFPAVRPFELEDFSVALKKGPAGDLAGMIGGTEFLSDENYLFTPRVPFTAKKVETNNTIRDPFTMQKEGAGLPRAVIFRDSFFTALVPFVAEHFSSSHFLWQRWNSNTEMEGIVRKYQPDVVIEEVVERLIKESSDPFAGVVPP